MKVVVGPEYIRSAQKAPAGHEGSSRITLGSAMALGSIGSAKAATAEPPKSANKHKTLDNLMIRISLLAISISRVENAPAANAVRPKRVAETVCCRPTNSKQTTILVVASGVAVEEVNDN